MDIAVANQAISHLRSAAEQIEQWTLKGVTTGTKGISRNDEMGFVYPAKAFIESVEIAGPHLWQAQRLVHGLDGSASALGQPSILQALDGIAALFGRAHADLPVTLADVGQGLPDGGAPFDVINRAIGEIKAGIAAQVASSFKESLGLNRPVNRPEFSGGHVFR
jgi:hypothetical protein